MKGAGRKSANRKKVRTKSKRQFVRRKSTHFFLGFIACWLSFSARGKDRLPNESAGTRFSWNEHRQLSWTDFKGAVDTQSDESAAATCCSIGFKLDKDTTGTPQITVYNTFYIDRSWVKEDARIGSILAHEQGHFDLCEVYTRKLRASVSGINLASPTAKQELMKVYSALSDEYEVRQQAYERETAHGTRIAQQVRWQEMIARELGEFQS